MTYFSEIVADRWAEAINEPTIQRWESLKDLTRRIIDLTRKEEPDSILIPMMEGVYRAASNRIVDLMPEQEAA